MAEHYFSNRPGAESQERQIFVEARGVRASLVSDRGVFSKDGLDDATRRLVERVDLSGAVDVLDLGAGYGVVTAILGRVYPSVRWTLVDINERAIGLARRNTAFLGANVTALVSDGVPEQLAESFDHVLLNPPIRAGKSVMYRLYDDARRSLRKSGSLWVVLQKKHGAPSTESKLQDLFGNVETVYRKSGYFIFRANKD